MLRLLVLVLMIPLVAGCMTMRSDLGTIRSSAESLGMKMLHPGAHARVCRSSVFGIPLESAQQPLREIFRIDPESDVLSHAQMTTESIATGVFNRICVELVGDLGREISVVRLPVVGDHEHHH